MRRMDKSEDFFSTLMWSRAWWRSSVRPKRSSLRRDWSANKPSRTTKPPDVSFVTRGWLPPKILKKASAAAPTTAAASTDSGLTRVVLLQHLVREAGEVIRRGRCKYVRRLLIWLSLRCLMEQARTLLSHTSVETTGISSVTSNDPTATKAAVAIKSLSVGVAASDSSFGQNSSVI